MDVACDMISLNQKNHLVRERNRGLGWCESKKNRERRVGDVETSAGKGSKRAYKRNAEYLTKPKLFSQRTLTLLV
jgi:hypothetical protein